MKGKVVRGILFVICILFVFWSAMCFTDYTRCKHLETPVFARAYMTNPDGHGEYMGLGYRVIVSTQDENGTEVGGIVRTEFMFLGRGVIRVEYVNGEINILKYTRGGI